MIELNKNYCCDNLALMSKMEDCSIDLTVTSPPYDNLRTYNGYSFDFESVAKELYRVTKDGGVVIWVVGDSTIKGSETGNSFRQALFFKECGFNLYDTMIYQKQNPVPLSHRRYEQEFEYMFVFCKGKPSTFNAIDIQCKCAGDEQWSESSFHKTPSSGLVKCAKRKVKEYKHHGNIFKYVASDIHSKKTWNHPAPFPEQLANDHIISWSNVGDIVFDPFVGSGTTSKMAKLNGRNYIGCDCSQEYIDIADERCKL